MGPMQFNMFNVIDGYWELCYVPGNDQSISQHPNEVAPCYACFKARNIEEGREVFFAQSYTEVESGKSVYL